MKTKTPKPSSEFIIFVVFLGVLAISFTRVHLRIQTTLLGYDIAKMKEQEAKLIKKRSLLTAEHAKITTKEYLNSLLHEFKDSKEKKQNVPLVFN